MNPSHPQSEGIKIFHKICGKSKVSKTVSKQNRTSKFSTNLPFAISFSTHHDLNQNIIDYHNWLLFTQGVTKFTLCRIKTIVTENYFQESRPTRPSAQISMSHQGMNRQQQTKSATRQSHMWCTHIQIRTRTHSTHNHMQREAASKTLTGELVKVVMQEFCCQPPPSTSDQAQYVKRETNSAGSLEQRCIAQLSIGKASFLLELIHKQQENFFPNDIGPEY